MIIPTSLPTSNSQQSMATTGAVLEAIGALAVFVILLYLGFMLLGALTTERLQYARVDELTLPLNQPLIPRRSRLSRTRPRNITSHPRQLAEQDLNEQDQQSSYGTMSAAAAYAVLAAEEFDADPSLRHGSRTRAQPKSILKSPITQKSSVLKQVRFALPKNHAQVSRKMRRRMQTLQGSLLMNTLGGSSSRPLTTDEPMPDVVVVFARRKEIQV
jgi:hypothetical protein